MSETIANFVDSFPLNAVRAVRSALAAGATIVHPDATWFEFRRHPAASLASMSARLDELSRAAQAPSPLVWCQSGDAASGLDDFELSAILGRDLHLDLVCQAAAGEEKRLVAIGAWREERIGLAFTLPDAASEPQRVQLLEAIGERNGSVAVAFVTAAAATGMMAQPAAMAALRACEASGVRLGLFVPASAIDAALADPAGHTAPLRALSREPVHCVRFANGSRLDAGALDRFMRAAELICDSSIAIDAGAAPANVVTRDAAYSGGSPYRPQPFDLRIPWFQCDAGMWLECPAQPVTLATLGTWWASRRGVSDGELTRLLDLERMEAYFRLARVVPDEERRYDEVRIYNWPPPAPAVRTHLLDGGEATAQQAREVIAAAAKLVVGTRARLVDHDTLLSDARSEVVARYATSPAQAIDAQHDAHSYLARVAHDAPLRPDYAAFARFAPAVLGEALEIGSGYGVLAWALSPRARRYTCVDLDPAMFSALRRDLGQSGVIADMHQLPFSTAAFDSIIANNVLEHLYDPLAGLREIRRVLKPGGRLLALVPFDALNSGHDLPAHHWKADLDSVQRALSAAGLEAARLDVVNLYALGVPGSFSSCHGFAVMIDARHPDQQIGTQSVSPASTLDRGIVRTRRPGGWQLPSVREIVGFERWSGRRVVAVGADANDLAEFRHFGSVVIPVERELAAWPVADGTADLVYAFLTLPPAELPRRLAEIERVLAPGGVVVAVFHHRDGLRYHSRVRSYFGEVCDLASLAGPDRLAQLADDVEADDEYVSSSEVANAFAALRHPDVSVHNLTSDDVLAGNEAGYPPAFWTWLAASCGRYVCVRAEK